MALGTPLVPQVITVHLGTPKSNARNVTLPFKEYIKNVASSEVYPTWPENALRANIYAITSFALNRVYTEYYRAQGYPFDMTNFKINPSRNKPPVVVTIIQHVRIDFKENLRSAVCFPPQALRCRGPFVA